MKRNVLKRTVAGVIALNLVIGTAPMNGLQLGVFNREATIVGAVDTIEIENNGYAYCVNMTSDSVEIKVDATADGSLTYQWQSATSDLSGIASTGYIKPADDEFNAIEGKTENVFSQSSMNVTYEGMWIRCMISDGTNTVYSEPLMLTKANASYWYLSNGTVAYRLSNQYILDVRGFAKDVRSNIYSWTETTYSNGGWRLNQRISGNTSQISSDKVAVQCSFDKTNADLMNIGIKLLNDTVTGFAMGADTKFHGNDAVPLTAVFLVAESKTAVSGTASLP